MCSFVFLADIFFPTVSDLAPDSLCPQGALRGAAEGAGNERWAHLKLREE